MILALAVLAFGVGVQSTFLERTIILLIGVGNSRGGDAGSLSSRATRACGLTVTDGFGDRRGGGGGVAGGGTLVDGGYLRYCVGGARKVCAATSQTLYGFSS